MDLNGTDLIAIGDAARLLGLNTSTLRYYDERGLVRPAVRQGGRRMYGPDELRRLAFVQALQHLGVGLDAAEVVLDGPSERWRPAVRERVAALDALIARAREAREFLGHALDCPADRPVQDCPHLIGLLDRRLAGASLEQLKQE